MTQATIRRGPKTPPPVVGRDQVEQAIWRLTKWRGAAGEVDRLLTVIDEYALAHGAILPNTFFGDNQPKHVRSGPAPGYVFDRMLSEDKRLRCNRCGHFRSLELMQIDARRPDGVRTECVSCRHKGIPVQEKYRGQRVYRLRTPEGWEESRRLRALPLRSTSLIALL